MIVHAWQVPAVGLATRQTAEKAIERENELLRRRIERQVRDNLVALAAPPRTPRIEMREGNPFFINRRPLHRFSPIS